MQSMTEYIMSFLHSEEDPQRLSRNVPCIKQHEVDKFISSDAHLHKVFFSRLLSLHSSKTFSVNQFMNEFVNQFSNREISKFTFTKSLKKQTYTDITLFFGSGPNGRCPVRHRGKFPDIHLFVQTNTHTHISPEAT